MACRPVLWIADFVASIQRNAPCSRALLGAPLQAGVDRCVEAVAPYLLAQSPGEDQRAIQARRLRQLADRGGNRSTLLVGGDACADELGRLFDVRADRYHCPAL